MWVRVDNRLIHGQIIETWLPFTGAQLLVVANDELAVDRLRQEIMSLAIPRHVEVRFTSVQALTPFLAESNAAERIRTMILFSSCADARRAFETGLAFDELNLGNLHFAPGKRQVCSHVALSSEDEDCIEFFVANGVRLDYRCVPGDTEQVRR